MSTRKGFIVPVLLALIAILLISGGMYVYISKPSKSPLSIPSAQVNQNLSQCGSVNQKALTKYNYQPTDVERAKMIKSLTCFNQALIKCSPASLSIENDNQVTSIIINGQGNSGCSASIQKYSGETTTCPLPSGYATALQKKFDANHYDSTIVTALVTDITAEVSAGNKANNCNVTKPSP